MATNAVTNSLFQVGSTASTAADKTTTAATTGSSDVTKDQFLQLLVAQLKNQDPMEPVKNEDFLTQMATFSSLEQLVDIKTGVNTLAGITTDSSKSDTTSSTQN